MRIGFTSGHIGMLREAKANYNVVEKQVISHHRYVVYSREVDDHVYYLDRHHKQEFADDLNRNIMIDFLASADGRKILELQIPLSIEHFKDAQHMSTIYKVIAHFTQDQRREYEKYLMIKKLSGDKISYEGS